MDPLRLPMEDGGNQKSAIIASTVNSISRPKVAKPPQIDVHSFSAFQAQSPTFNSASPVRRKPLPPSASPSQPLRNFSTGDTAVANVQKENSPGNPTRDLRPPPGSSSRIPWLPTPNTSPKLVLRDLDQFPRGNSPLIPQSPGNSAFPDLSADKARQALLDLDYNTPVTTRPNNHLKIASDPHDPPKMTKAQGRVPLQRSTTMPLQVGRGPAPLQLNNESHSRSSQGNDSQDGISTTIKSNKLTSFFGWKASGSSPIIESSPTTISDRSHSPARSPRSPLYQSFPSSFKPLPKAIDIPKANAPAQGSYFQNPNYPRPPATPAMSVRLDEMEEELREVSSELANSIRREMELEDEVERLQSEVPQAPELSRRTSDYFSDSGTSSIRYPPSESGGTKLEDLEKMRRRSEQEKAQMRLDLSQKLQEERGRRKVMEAYIRSLEEHVQDFEQSQMKSSAGPARIQELEAALEDNRRRLQEERQLKENYEDLLAALRGEIEQHRDERDNLRDEVVPQLRNRLDGLESEAAEFQKLTYENARMQQEIQSLKNENAHLINVNRLQNEAQRSPRFGSIMEESSSPTTPTMKTGLTRSASLARGTATAEGLARSGSLSGSNSKERESRESLADRVKEIEMQRDALHRALRSLLDRQKYQSKEHEKRIKYLEHEREKALESHSPRRRGYEKEVTGLRFEINQLRRRADEALEHKWQSEKGLGGLKKDLDRAEQETSSLRMLLQENDILIPEESEKPMQEFMPEMQATSRSLEKAHKELQAAQALTITRLRELRGNLPSGADDAKTEETMDLLLKSMSDAEAERDFAQKQAETYRAEAESLQEVTSFHEGENTSLTEQLRASANRINKLSTQVRSQLESNSDLRSRLAETVGRGERDQKASTARINNMQGRLKSLEDRLMAAQQHSEESVQMHEDELLGIRNSNNTHLQRLKSGLRSPTSSLHPVYNSRNSPRSPRSPLFHGAKSPRLDKTSSGVGMKMNEALRTEYLERRVIELEKALGEADSEMQEVVQRMNMAQIEVMELQSARDDAMRQTKTLQAQIMAESENVGSLMKYLHF